MHHHLHCAVCIHTYTYSHKYSSKANPRVLKESHEHARIGVQPRACNNPERLHRLAAPHEDAVISRSVHPGPHVGVRSRRCCRHSRGHPTVPPGRRPGPILGPCIRHRSIGATGRLMRMPQYAELSRSVAEGGVFVERK